MTIRSIGTQSGLAIRSLVEMRARLDDLQRQLATGKRSDTYAGIGLDRGLTVSLRTQLSAIGGFGDAIASVLTRISVMQTSLGRVSEIGHDIKGLIVKSNFDPDSGGQTTTQQTALAELHELVGLLNSRAGERYLFSGRTTDQPPVVSTDLILDGDGVRAGLKQLIAERNQADIGASGLGRLAITAPTADSISVAEDAVSPFGFKLAALTGNLTGSALSGPAGVPPEVVIDLAGNNPNAGEQVTLRFTLPDGTSESITLTATAASPAGANEFTIGATSDDTATNLQTALTASIGLLARTSLSAASAVKASEEFFSGDALNPPQRVDGPPFDSATTQIAGTTANTVYWYVGETGSDPARSTAVARIDQSLTVSYGTRANEEGIRWLVQNVATLAAMSFSPLDPDASARSEALDQRLIYNLDGPPGLQKVENISADLAGAQVSLKAAQNRHLQTEATLSDMLDQVEGISNEEVGAHILALQTRLQASLQTTAMLYQTSLLYYL